MTNTFDSIIFDMDGTLWDAVDSYCKIWDTTFNQLGIQQTVSRDELLKCMGMPIHEIFSNIANLIINIDEQHFLNLLDKNEQEMMPILGGKLYAGVFEGIKLLSGKYKLYMVSNCGADGLNNFLSFTQLKPYFNGTLTHGETLLPKADNIKLLIERNNLNNAVYVGDTQGDCDAAHKAGIPMIFAKYGFGECKNAEYSIESFSDLLDLLFKNLYK